MEFKPEDQFCSFAVSVRLKVYGFDEECLFEYHKNKLVPNSCGPGHYCNNSALEELFTDVYAAPLYQQAVNWLKINHSIKIIEDAQNGYYIYLKLNDNYFQHTWVSTIENAIHEALDYIK